MRAVGTLALSTVLALTGCAGDAGPPVVHEPGTVSPGGSVDPRTPTNQTTAIPTKGAGTGRLLKTSQSEFGSMLFDGSGQAIYLFDKETTSRAECYQACAVAWPPVLTEGSPRTTGAVRSQLIGTTERTDGATQVTYDGHPLYYYAHEGKNEVLCHNVVEFGGRWLVVTPAGDPAD